VNKIKTKSVNHIILDGNEKKAKNHMPKKDKKNI